MSRVEDYLPMIDTVLKYKFPSFAKKDSYSCKVHFIEYGDLVGVGTIGLLKAEDTYDVEKGTKFDTHAFNCIYSEIIHFLRDNNYCGKFSRTVKEIAVRVLKKQNNELTPKFVMELEDVDYDMALDVCAYLDRKKYSLDTLVPNPKGVSRVTFKDLVPDRINVEMQVVRKIEFEDKMAMLNESARRICMLSLKGASQSEIANITGLSQSRISRIMKSSIRLMNEAYRL